MAGSAVARQEAASPCPALAAQSCRLRPNALPRLLAAARPGALKPESRRARPRGRSRPAPETSVLCAGGRKFSEHALLKCAGQRREGA